MTGEMLRSDLTEDAYPIHFAIARELNGTVQPFDVYQGPYVVIGSDVRLGREPYAVAPLHLGVVRLWLCSDDGALCTIYNEATDKQSDPFWWNDTEAAVDAARSLLGA